LSNSEVLELVDQIIPLLAEYGHSHKADWLREESKILRTPGRSEDEWREAMKKLHAIVPGMGGLMDLPIVTKSPEEQLRVRKELDDLGDRLYRLTK
jgi:hypothetical protein